MILQTKSDSLKLFSGTSFCILNNKLLNNSIKFSAFINGGIALIFIFSVFKSKSKPNWFKIFLLDLIISISALEKSISNGWSNFWGLTLFSVTDFKNSSYNILWCALSWFIIMSPDLVLLTIYFLFNWIGLLVATSELKSSKLNSFSSLLSD